MALRLQVVVIICMVIAIAYVSYLTRKKKIDFRYALGWIFVCICVLLFSVLPGVLGAVTQLLGFATPSNMLFFLGFIFSLMIIFSLSRSVSELSDKVKKLSQELAILRKDTFDGMRQDSDEKDEEDVC